MSIPKRSLLAVTCAITIGVPSAATAQDSPSPIVVTATRTAQTADEALTAVTVITRADIERSQARDLPELLRRQTGVDVTAQGGFGKQSSVFLRGTNPGHVLVLVDGVRHGSATAGTTAFELIPIEQIERVEIVRGPRSSLYGSEAVGGVIHVVTRAGRGAPGANAELGYGHYGMRRLAAGMSGGDGATHWGVQLGSERSDGYDVYTPREPDADGYRNDSASARLAHRFAGGHELELHGMRAQGETEFDAFMAGAENRMDFVQQTVGLRGSYVAGDNWLVKTQIGESRDEADNLADGTFSSTFDTRRHYAGVQNDLALGEAHLLSAGADWHRDEVRSTTPYDDTSRHNTGLFAQLQSQLGDHDLGLGARRDDDQQFGAHKTWHANYGYRLGAAYRLLASYGTAFKAPTFNDLYWPGFGNPDLEPQTSESVELGLRATPAWGRWELRAFRTDIEKLLVFNFDTFQMEQVGRARIDGVELEAGTRLGEWDLGAGATWLSPRDRDSGQVLPRRVRESYAVHVDRRFGGGEQGRWGMGATTELIGSRYDDAGNNVRVSGFELLHLRADYALDRRWTLRAKLDNALGKEYQTVHNYRMPGRVWFASVVYRTP